MRMAALLWVLLMAPLVATARPRTHHVTVDGLWDGPGGQVELTNTSGHVIGRLVRPAAGVSLKANSTVLDGTVVEDNLTADVQLGAVVPGCGATESTAFAVLLVTRSGKLTGGAVSKAPCAAVLSSITFRRSSTGLSVVNAVVEPENYDPRGNRLTPLPDAVHALLVAGKEDMEAGKFEQARHRFERARGLAPDVGETYNLIGATFAARSDYGTAINFYKRGLGVAPGLGDLYYNLACAYAQINKPKLSLRYLKLSVLKGYKEVSALDADHDLDTLRDDPEFAAIRKIMTVSVPDNAP